MDNSAPIVEVRLGPVATAADRDAALLADLPRQAREALAATDWRVVRAAETGEPVPTAWRTYRDALRAVVSGQSNTLPDEPL